jgi:nucleoside-diphosphate-sugar epimerase
MKVFVAGATGAIGRRLMPILLRSGATVAGSTRSPEKIDALRDIGVTPYLVDVYDAAALKLALAEFSPDVVIHQLTDLPSNLEPSQMRAGIERNARIRRDGTQHLVDAAVPAGSKRIIAQSIAWVYAPGPEPHPESDPLDFDAEEPRSISIAGVVALEAAVLQAPGMTPIVLRYGQIYGPGTGTEAPKERLSVHVDAAAHAAFLAISRGRAGVYNIAEQDVAVTSAKAREELGWKAEYRLVA